jgi:hypothetical protein
MALLVKMGTGVLLFAALFVAMAMVFSSCTASRGTVITTYIYRVFAIALLHDF